MALLQRYNVIRGIIGRVLKRFKSFPKILVKVQNDSFESKMKCVL